MMELRVPASEFSMSHPVAYWNDWRFRFLNLFPEVDMARILRALPSPTHMSDVGVDLTLLFDSGVLLDLRHVSVLGPDLVSIRRRVAEATPYQCLVVPHTYSPWLYPQVGFSGTLRIMFHPQTVAAVEEVAE